MDHCIVEYGGYGYNANIWIDSASPTIENCTIRHGSGSGIRLTGSSKPTIGGEGEGNQISNNAAEGILSEGDLVEPIIVGNTLSNNGGYAASIRAQLYGVRGNSGDGNGYDAIALQGGVIGNNTTWALNSLPYCVLDNIEIRWGSYSPILTIEPGVTIKFDQGVGLMTGYLGNYIYKGALDAQGTIDSPITFTSMATAPAPGDWKGIHFTNRTRSDLTKLKHCIIEYGGHTNGANLWMDSSSPTIENCTIHHSSAAGIRITGAANPTVQWSTIRNNADGILLNTTSSPIVKYNSIENNTDLGANNLNESVQVAAIHNWWGAASGPQPYGTGNGVSDNILVSPWALDPSDFDGDSIYDPYELAFHGNLEAIDSAPDNDNDGMTDDWEYRYGLDYTINDAYLDLDGDGYFNIIEFRYSYDPSSETNRPEFNVLYEYDAMGRITRTYHFN